MSVIEPVLLGVLLLGGFEFTPEARGDETSPNAATSVPPLQTTLKHEESIGPEQVRRAYISAGTNCFAFVVPPDFRLDVSNPHKIVLVNSDNSCFVTFQILAPTTPESYRDRLLSQYPGGTILNEFVQTVGNRSGPAFDVQWTNAGSAVQAARITFIPSAAGVLEFSLTTGSNDFSKSQCFLDLVLLTFRTNEGGKLEIAPFSETT